MRRLGRIKSIVASLACLAIGCGPPEPSDDVPEENTGCVGTSAPETAGTPTVDLVVGSHDAELPPQFTPWLQGTAVELQRGFQGAWMIVPSVQLPMETTILEGECARLEIEVGDNCAVGCAFLSVTLAPGRSGKLEAGPAYVPLTGWSEEMLGEEQELRATLATSSETAEANLQVRIVNRDGVGS